MEVSIGKRIGNPPAAARTGGGRGIRSFDPLVRSVSCTFSLMAEMPKRAKRQGIETNLKQRLYNHAPVPVLPQMLRA